MNLFKIQIYLFLILFVCFAQPGISQVSGANEAFQDSISNQFQNNSISLNNDIQKKITIIKYDSSNVEVRTIDSTKIKAYLKDKDFKYFEDPEYTTTLWERILEWIKGFFSKLFSFDPKGVTGDVLQYLLIAFAFIAIFYVLYRNEIKGLFSKNKSIDSIKSFETIEDIHSIDYEKLIEQAIENKNYRYAIRLNYIRTLKILTDKEFINWKPDKTNREFINELKVLDIKSSFVNLTNDFEKIWYGEHSINFINYSSLAEKYSDFRLLLETNQK